MNRIQFHVQPSDSGVLSGSVQVRMSRWDFVIVFRPCCNYKGVILIKYEYHELEDARVHGVLPSCNFRSTRSFPKNHASPFPLLPQNTPFTLIHGPTRYRSLDCHNWHGFCHG
jgi:hypothetical protein